MKKDTSPAGGSSSPRWVLLSFKAFACTKKTRVETDGRRHGLVQLAITWTTMLFPETLTPDPARRA